MAKIHLSKIKGKNNMELKVGDVILEVNRFNKNDYIIYRILDISPIGWCNLLILKSTTSLKSGRVVSGEVDCFFGGRNVKWLSYYLPAGKVLYGKADT